MLRNRPGHDRCRSRRRSVWLRDCCGYRSVRARFLLLRSTGRRCSLHRLATRLSFAEHRIDLIEIGRVVCSAARVGVLFWLVVRLIACFGNDDRISAVWASGLGPGLPASDSKQAVTIVAAEPDWQSRPSVVSRVVCGCTKQYSCSLRGPGSDTTRNAFRS